jgi:hypothetical protein
MRIRTDQTKALNADTLTAFASGRPDAMLRVLECKAGAGEAATEVTDLAMRVCGGAAFRKEVGVERIFRDARAATVMAPTTDVLYDFIGKAVSGMRSRGCMMRGTISSGAVAYDPKCDHLGRLPCLVRQSRLRATTTSLHATNARWTRICAATCAYWNSPLFG